MESGEYNNRRPAQRPSPRDGSRAARPTPRDGSRAQRPTARPSASRPRPADPASRSSASRPRSVNPGSRSSNPAPRSSASRATRNASRTQQPQSNRSYTRDSRQGGRTSQPSRRPPQQRSESARSSNARARAAAAPRQKRPTNTRLPLVPIIAIVIIVLLLWWLISSFACAKPNNAASQNAATTSAASTAASSEGRVSFVAVGDNLPNAPIGQYADRCAGEEGDGAYDYRPIFAQLKPYVEAADLAYISEEVALNGNDIGPQSYPSFNVTDEMSDAVIDAGFDLVATASNHSYDWGRANGVAHAVALWNSKPVSVTGMATDAEQANTIPQIERNGITFSFLSYTYGLNGYEDLGLPWYTVNLMDPDRITADVKRAKEQSDVVLVAMHWGTEYKTGIDDMQQEYAQLLADLGVDVVLGSHPHCIGPVEYVTGSSGNKTLVVYSMGNLLSNHADPLPISSLGGMFGCDFVKTSQGVEIQNPTWTPLVNHDENDQLFCIYPLKDYTAELAAKNSCFVSTSEPVDNPLTWMRDTSANIVGSVCTLT